MPVTTNIEIAGLKKTINSLNKLEPGLRKQFLADSRKIAEPALREARNAYTKVPLSGMARPWTQEGRELFPFTVAGAQKGVRLGLITRRNALGAVVIEQSNIAAAISETAGRKTRNSLSTNLDREVATVKAGRSRLFGPAVYRSKRKIEKELETMVLKVTNRVDRELKK